MVGRTLDSRLNKGRHTKYIDYDRWGGGWGWFIAHKRAHNLSRSEFYFKYRGPYMKLRDEGNLEKAIPHIINKGAGHSLPDEGIKKIARAYNIYKANSDIASQKLGYCKATILKYWKILGLKIRPIGHPGQDGNYKIERRGSLL